MASYADLYRHHVDKASEWQMEATRRKAKARLMLIEQMPNADSLSISREASKNLMVKEAVDWQQFHTREATKYGLGMMNETLAQVLKVVSK